MTLPNESTTSASLQPVSPVSRWLSWNGCLMVVLLATVARLAFIIWLCPFELSGDEAQYWDWSRRLDWSYYSKGPGVAWTIAPSTGLFGPSDWSVRLPAVIWAVVATLAMARLTMDVASARGCTPTQIARAGLCGTLAFTLFVGYQFSGVAMTIDGPHMAWWLLACWATFRAFYAWYVGRRGMAAWMALGAAIGIGMLFKYTIAILLPGVIVFAIIARRSLTFRFKPVVASLFVMLLFLSPIVIWNANNDWVTVKHLIGRMGLPGGDEKITKNNAASFGLTWFIRMLGDQLALLNITVIVFILAMRRGRKHEQPGGQTDGRSFPAFTLMVCLALPILLMYTGISFISKIQANWPLPGYATLLVMMAAALGTVENRQSVLARWWKAWMVLGLVVFAGSLMSGLVVASDPIRKAIPALDRAIVRLSVAPKVVEAVQPAIEEVRRRTGQEPIIVAHHYMDTARLAFYLPGQPSVMSAASYQGERKSSYDYFKDTDLRNRALFGRPAILYGGTPDLWARSFMFDRVEQPSPDVPTYIGWNYQGPRSGRTQSKEAAP